MAFPTDPAYGIESAFVAAKGHSISTSIAGNAVVFDRFNGKQIGAFRLVYRALTAGQVQTLTNDYNTNSFTFTWEMDSPTDNYTVVYAGKPVRVHNELKRFTWDVFTTLLIVPDFSGTLNDETDTALDTEADVDIEIE